MDYKVNINEFVKVKLTERGINILKKQHEELNDMIKERGGKGLGELKIYFDEEGYTQMQLWTLMHYFGEHMTMGSEMPFEAEIIMTNGKMVMMMNKQK